MSSDNLEFKEVSSPADVIIVGAGISGLSIGYYLHQRQPDWHIRVLEASHRAGGTIWTEHSHGFTLEYGPNGFLANKTSTLDLIHQLGLESELISAQPAARYRYVYDGQKLHRLPDGLWSFLRFALLPWLSKWAILTERWRRRSPPDEEESISAFISRRTDAATADLLGELLVTGIYAGDPNQLSMRACFPRIVALEQQYGSVTRGFLHAARQRKRLAQQEGRAYLRGSQLLSLRGGLRSLIDKLTDKLQQSLILNRAVQRIEYVPNTSPVCWRVITDRAIYLSRRLVLACPAYVQAQLLRSIDESLADLVGTIPYVPIIVIALGYKEEQLVRPLNGFGYLTLRRSKSIMLGAQWCSSIFPYRAPSGHVLIRYMTGGVRQPHILDYSDAELVQLAHEEACQVLGITSPPVYNMVIRWPRAIPQYILGHLARLSKIQDTLKRLPGLYLAGNAYHGVSLNDCTEQASLLADQIIRHTLSSLE
ncbi:MAG: protoporphyrinogen oxidase [Gemmatales bacterium]|nr:protoporphyrinogen oxidase [Gemmatales bacterium]MDW7993763.1 protoporphyrinogen oxidase [Gemmatales bacterium]